MDLVEKMIWFLTPILLAILLSQLLKGTSWISKKYVMIVSAVQGVICVIVAPTVFCSDGCSKLLGAFFFSVLVSLSVLLSTLLIQYLLGIKKQVKNKCITKCSCSPPSVAGTSVPSAAFVVCTTRAPNYTAAP